MTKNLDYQPLPSEEEENQDKIIPKYFEKENPLAPKKN